MQKGLKWIFFLCFSTIFIGFSQFPAGAVTISFNPQDQETWIGGQVDVDIVVSDLLPDEEEIGAYDFNVTYDSSIIEFTDMEFGSALGYDGFSLANYDPSLGIGGINIWEISFLSELELWELQQPNFTLATLSFTGLAEGNSFLDITPGIVPPIFSDSEGELLDYDVVTGSIKVTTPVPEPNTMLLFGIGLAGLAGVGRKKRN